MKSIIVRIEGITPLLMHRFADSSLVSIGGARPVHVKDEDPRTVAEHAAYRDADGNLYIPGASISRLLREAGASHKQKGSRRSLKYIIPGVVIVSEDELPLYDSGTTRATHIEVDSRAIVNPVTKARVMCHRARLNRWECEFVLEIDDEAIAVTTVNQLLVEGGRRIGLGAFRPEKGGPFGRFMVTSWV
jgi:hypothetical protein